VGLKKHKKDEIKGHQYKKGEKKKFSKELQGKLDQQSSNS
jgi:hypothetical protein